MGIEQVLIILSKHFLLYVLKHVSEYVDINTQTDKNQYF